MENKGEIVTAELLVGFGDSSTNTDISGVCDVFEQSTERFKLETFKADFSETKRKWLDMLHALL